MLRSRFDSESRDHVAVLKVHDVLAGLAVDPSQARLDGEAPDRVAEVVAVRMERCQRQVGAQRERGHGAAGTGKICVQFERPREQRNEDGAAGTMADDQNFIRLGGARLDDDAAGEFADARVQVGPPPVRQFPVPGPHRADPRYQPTPAQRAGHRKEEYAGDDCGSER